MFAIALQLDPANRKIRLAIAGNQGVEDKVVDHITNIWAKLRALSNEYAENRGREWNEGGESPEVPGEIGIPLKVAIFREVYLFSLEKHLKRAGKWKDGFLVVMREFAKSRRGTPLRSFDLDLHGTAAPLFLLLKSLNELHVHPGNDLTYDEWKTMYNYSMLVSQGVERVLGKRFSCEVLASQLKGILFCFPLPY